jgi:hypothetical protein
MIPPGEMLSFYATKIPAGTEKSNSSKAFCRYFEIMKKHDTKQEWQRNQSMMKAR